VIEGQTVTSFPFSWGQCSPLRAVLDFGESRLEGIWLALPRLHHHAIRSIGPEEHCARTWLLGLAAAFVCTGPFMIALLNPPLDPDSPGVCRSVLRTSACLSRLLTVMGLVVVGSFKARMTSEKPSPRRLTSP